MGLFSKEPCVFCDNNVGFFSRKKMQDKNYICKECEKNCSAYIDISRYDKEYASAHIDRMKRQNNLYNKEFATLAKEKKEHFGYQFSGFNFADDIGMFEYYTSKYEKKNYKELIRYDAIQSYEIFEVQNTQENGGRKFSEIGVKIKLKSLADISSVSMSDSEKAKAHPYISEIKCVLDKNTDVSLNAEKLINKLDDIFRKEHTYKTIGDGIKESFIGTETERRHIKETASDIKNLAGLAKASIGKDESLKEQYKDNLKESAINHLTDVFGEVNPIFTKYADEAEKRAWTE